MRGVLVLLLAAMLVMAHAQLTFTPNWGKRSVSREDPCKQGDTLIAIYKLIENEAERLLVCQK